MTTNVEQAVHAAYSRTVTIMIFIGISILAYLVLNYYFGTTGEGTADRDFATLRISFTVIVLFLGLGAVALRRVMYGTARIAAVQSTSGSTGLLNYLTRVSLLQAVLAEAASLAGLIYGFLTRDTGHASSLILVGMIVLVFSFPRRRAWQRAATATEAS